MLAVKRCVSCLKSKNSLFLPMRFFAVDIEKPVTEHTDNYPVTKPQLPIITSRPLPYPSKYVKPREAWVCNLDTVEEELLGIIDLHPSVFGVMPRLDIIFHNYRWQQKYRFVDYVTELSRAEVPGGGRKPWPQKGTGRARHGSIRSPIFLRGGKAHGKRGPKTTFYMLPRATRVYGLTSTLSCKFAQDDLVIVNSLEIPTNEQKFIEELMEHRRWGISVLFINETDIMPRNITLATDKMESVVLMPYYGLNVYSMLKYDTIVMTLEALNKIEERLLFHLHRSDLDDGKFNRFDFNKSVLKNSDVMRMDPKTTT
ncbi:39S ribosomal protein L4, mitochondrial-like isoform X2 [Stegodyphus dumicola]|nr:39S ribosomal protein L4, mitochondrial-like isoform X2 [Stegodyphus dumicola]XP_035226204.1 39S ribosomal protein L4, mitochondrial-like isoform X2 [Stegodyphus dumicola]XP_035226205.1 39S ribosomal protein L4, mitochondrial-like isoform X2 [Stegodyphus dumicola]